MAWSNARTLADNLSVAATPQASVAVQLAGEERLHAQLTVSNSGSTDDLEIEIQTTLDPSDTEALSATVAAGGSGYSEDDVLTLSGGQVDTAATFIVTGESSGVVTSVALVSGGSYRQIPSNPVSTTGGGGSGCTLNVTWDETPWDNVGLETADTVDGGNAPDVWSKVVGPGVYRARLMLTRSGSTDTFTVDGTYRTDKIELR